jgi:hypothetical protein
MDGKSMETGTAMNVETLDMLPGEGDMKTITMKQLRKECGQCGEPAHFKQSYLVAGNPRGNRASSAYGRDDCSWCSDHEEYLCRTCKAPSVDGYEQCSKFPAINRFKHMFLYWYEEKP